MPIQPVKKNNINDQIFEQMKDMLISGEWKPGEKIPSEHELSEMFGVSRVTLRNALQRLAALGLIETRRGEGSFVREQDIGNCLNTLIPTAYLMDDIAEVQWYRLMIEPGAAYIAARRATEEDIADLRARLAKMETLKEDLLGLAHEDFAFHKQVALITKNALMTRTYEILEDVLLPAMEKLVALVGPEDGSYYHAEVVNAIAAQDGGRARDMMQRHIELNIEKYKNI